MVDYIKSVKFSHILLQKYVFVIYLRINLRGSKVIFVVAELNFKF